MKSASIAPQRPRLAIFSRVSAAVFGGYLLTSACIVFLSYIIPIRTAEAVLTATLLSFALYTGAVIWVFAAPTAGRAWAGMLLPTVALGLASLGFYLATGSTA
ncbi:DUF3649 domain-containing protein [Azoarcus indigens]|uniref:Uncharacterized protein DUF3649 n=1 Tax=Azoarcus indigens TaxID=29545 RepID=A0A4R6DUU4_9RHOO|nr:DUF3649 domain-containing protein [Azoarcus indigens]NMG65087.1 DUF3649 domain-containing protein [Azoarcus indigens]TDN48980.1 uncharacterized protein DUF3649 [Azoarcus indigens]